MISANESTRWSGAATMDHYQIRGTLVEHTRGELNRPNELRREGEKEREREKGKRPTNETEY